MSDDREAYLEGCVDALDHIRRTANASRTQTRRLRWIEARARCAVEGGEDWRDIDLPQSAESQSKRVLDLQYRLSIETERREAAEAVVDEIPIVDEVAELMNYYTNYRINYPKEPAT